MVKVGPRLALGIALAIACSAFPVASAPLSPQGTPVGDESYFHYFGQDLVLVGAYDGLYKATDSGWQKIYPLTYYNLRVTPDRTFYIYTGDSGEILRSSDEGETWNLVGTTIVLTTVGSIKFYPSPLPDVFFLGTGFAQPLTDADQGIYKSTDRGATWKKAQAGNIWDVAVSPNFAQDGIAFASLFGYHSAGPILKTTDWGETWSYAVNGLPMGFSPEDAYNIAISPQFAQDQTVFAACGLGLYGSTDQGETWTTIFGPDRPSRLPHSVAVSPYYLYDQTLVYWGDDNDFQLSQDGGRTWRQGAGIVASPRAGGIRYAGPFGSGLAPSAPGPYRFYLPLVSVSNTLLELWYVGRDYFGDPYLYRSRDYGATWQQVDVFEVSHWLYLPLVSKDTVSR